MYAYKEIINVNSSSFKLRRNLKLNFRHCLKLQSMGKSKRSRVLKPIIQLKLLRTVYSWLCLVNNHNRFIHNRFRPGPVHWCSLSILQKRSLATSSAWKNIKTVTPDLLQNMFHTLKCNFEAAERKVPKIKT